jgi:hypothetical protein
MAAETNRRGPDECWHAEKNCAEGNNRPCGRRGRFPLNALQDILTRIPWYPGSRRLTSLPFRKILDDPFPIRRRGRWSPATRA